MRLLSLCVTLILWLQSSSVALAIAIPFFQRTYNVSQVHDAVHGAYSRTFSQFDFVGDCPDQVSISGMFTANGGQSFRYPIKDSFISKWSVCQTMAGFSSVTMTFLLMDKTKTSPVELEGTLRCGVYFVKTTIQEQSGSIKTKLTVQVETVFQSSFNTKCIYERFSSDGLPSPSPSPSPPTPRSTQTAQPIPTGTPEITNEATTESQIPTTTPSPTPSASLTPRPTLTGIPTPTGTPTATTEPTAESHMPTTTPTSNSEVTPAPIPTTPPPSTATSLTPTETSTPTTEMPTPIQSSATPYLENNAGTLTPSPTFSSSTPTTSSTPDKLGTTPEPSQDSNSPTLTPPDQVPSEEPPTTENQLTDSPQPNNVPGPSGAETPTASQTLAAPTSPGMSATPRPPGAETPTASATLTAPTFPGMSATPSPSGVETPTASGTLFAPTSPGMSATSTSPGMSATPSLIPTVAPTLSSNATSSLPPVPTQTNFTSTPRPLKSSLPSPTTSSGGPDLSTPQGRCFPRSATVQLADGSIITMDKLNIGHRVRTGSVSSSPVYMFSHRIDHGMYEFVRLRVRTHVDQMELALSPLHYIYANGRLVTAESIKVGDLVETIPSAGGMHHGFVENVRFSQEEGLFNPHTLDGDLVVNGVRVSSFTQTVSPRLAHALLIPARMTYALGFQNPAGMFFDRDQPELTRLALPGPAISS